MEISVMDGFRTWVQFPPSPPFFGGWFAYFIAFVPERKGRHTSSSVSGYSDTLSQWMPSQHGSEWVHF